MSPEQVEASEIDHRSDLYSLGLIIYEMFTADLPFRGSSAMQVMYQRVNAAPKDPRELCPEMPEFAANIILKCLARDRADRYQSAREILNDIDAQSAPVVTPSRPGSISVQIPRLSRRTTLIAGGVVAAILGLTFGIPASRKAVLSLLPGGSSGTPKIEHYLAVMPLATTDEGGALKYVAEGVGDALSAKLAGLRNVYVAAGNTVSPAITKLSDDRIAKALGVTILVRGMVQNAGEKVAITIKMDDVKNGKSLLIREFAGVRGDLLTIEDQMFTSVAEALRIRQSNEEKARTTAKPTEDIDAYEAYLKGRSLFNGTLTQAKMDEALKLFDQAIRKDPQFALAYAGLADAYLRSWRLSKDPSKAVLAQNAAEQAKRINDNLPEAHFTLGSIYTNTGHTAEAIVELNRALQLAPNSDEALRRLGLAYRAAGQPDKAIAAGLQAVKVNPYLWNNYNALATTYDQLGQNEKSVAALRRATELAPENPTCWANLGAAYYRLGRWSDAIPVFQKAIELEPKAFYYSQLGVAFFFVGKFQEAAKIFETAVEKDSRNDFIKLNLADAYRWSNQRDKAAAAYDSAIALSYRTLEVNPKSSEAMVNLALAYAKKGDATSAARFIRQARQLESANYDYMYADATIHTLAGEFPAAFASLKEALTSGYSLEETKADPELKILRERPEFEQLVKEIAKKPVK
jgi:serine/threonine-protein kinase